MRSHVDHIRDYFVTITTVSPDDPTVRVAQMHDSELEKPKVADREWKDMLDKSIMSDDLIVSEFDPFKDFIAVYCKRNGRPEIII